MDHANAAPLLLLTPLPTASGELPGNDPALPDSFGIGAQLCKASAAAKADRNDDAVAHFADAARRLRDAEKAADTAQEDVKDAVKRADEKRVLALRGARRIGHWLQRQDRSKGGKGKKGGVYSSAIKAGDLSDDKADVLRWMSWIPDDEFERRIAAGVRSKQKLADIGRVEFDKDGKPTGRSVDQRSVTDDRFPYIKNVERKMGDEIDVLHDIADAWPDPALRSKMWRVLCQIQLGIADAKNVDPRPAVALVDELEPSLGRLTEGLRVLGGIGEEAIRLENANSGPKAKP